MNWLASLNMLEGFILYIKYKIKGMQINLNESMN